MDPVEAFSSVIRAAGEQSAKNSGWRNRLRALLIELQYNEALITAYRGEVDGTSRLERFEEPGSAAPLLEPNAEALGVVLTEWLSSPFNLDRFGRVEVPGAQGRAPLFWVFLGRLYNRMDYLASRLRLSAEYPALADKFRAVNADLHFSRLQRDLKRAVVHLVRYLDLSGPARLGLHWSKKPLKGKKESI